MRYIIEYLHAWGDEDAVCLVRASPACSLEEATAHAWAHARRARTRYAARGFQIRDLFGEDGQLLLVAEFHGEIATDVVETEASQSHPESRTG